MQLIGNLCALHRRLLSFLLPCDVIVVDTAVAINRVEKKHCDLQLNGKVFLSVNVDQLSDFRRCVRIFSAMKKKTTVPRVTLEYASEVSVPLPETVNV